MGIAHDAETSETAKIKRSTDGLLKLLHEHHTFDLSLPRGWKRPEPSAPPEERTISVEPRRSPPPVGTPDDIKRAVCRHFEISNDELCSRSRLFRFVYARHIAMHLFRSRTTLSLPAIASRVGGMDHTTVLYGTRKIANEVLSNWEVAFDVAHIEAAL